MTDDEIKQAWEDATGSCWPDEGCFTAGEYDRHISAFARKIRNAALDEAANKCHQIAVAPSNVNLGVALDCEEQIRSMKK